MATKMWAICVVLLCTVFTSFGQILLKIGTENTHVVSMLSNWHLWLGIIFYILSGVLLIISFKGGSVSTLYPIIATSYIWVSFLAFHYLGESLTVWKWFGISLVLLGVIFMGIGGKYD